jgi:hypothetical protein
MSAIEKAGLVVFGTLKQCVTLAILILVSEVLK